MHVLHISCINGGTGVRKLATELKNGLAGNMSECERHVNMLKLTSKAVHRELTFEQD